MKDKKQAKRNCVFYSDKLSPAEKMHLLTIHRVFPSCTTSLLELFDHMSSDRPVFVSGEPGCAKSFNIILLLLYFHDHGLPHQLSGLFGNQKTHVQAGYDNARTAMNFYQDITNLKQPIEKEDDWPFLAVTGDYIKGNRNPGKLKLVINTSATSEETRRVDKMR